MITPTEVQLIQHDGKPAFAVIPYARYIELIGHDPAEEVYLPHEVVGLQIKKGLSAIAAWRVHLKMSQTQLATKLGITQPALAKLEKPEANPRQATLEKVAHALGVDIEQLTD